MRIVRLQVSAAQTYVSKNGTKDVRSMLLEAVLDSSDSETSVMWDIQRQLDQALESWIDLHQEEAAEAPAPERVPVDDKIPF